MDASVSMKKESQSNHITWKRLRRQQSEGLHVVYWYIETKGTTPPFVDIFGYTVPVCCCKSNMLQTCLRLLPSRVAPLPRFPGEHPPESELGNRPCGLLPTALGFSHVNMCACAHNFFCTELCYVWPGQLCILQFSMPNHEQIWLQQWNHSPLKLQRSLPPPRHKTTSYPKAQAAFDQAGGRVFSVRYVSPSVNRGALSLGDGCHEPAYIVPWGCYMYCWFDLSKEHFPMVWDSHHWLFQNEERTSRYHSHASSHTHLLRGWTIKSSAMKLKSIQTISDLKYLHSKIWI